MRLRGSPLNQQQQHQHQRQEPRHRLWLWETPQPQPNIMAEPIAPAVLPQFGFREIILGRSVGKGGFSVVQEVTSIDLDEVYDTCETSARLRRDVARTANSKISNGSSGSQSNKYVLKMLRTDLPDEEYTKGMVDLAIEAEFLAQVAHPHIIAMRATAQSDPYDARYFVILDRLTQTLERKFNYWRKVIGENAGYYMPCYGYCCSNAIALHAVWKERLQVALDLSTALAYLHQHGIVYRDLKPDNVGFDGNMQVKLFDFGLAKRLNDVERAAADENGGGGGSGGTRYLLTGNTGSLRYMAPEVALDEPYNESVDAYSFGILFWQMCALVTPFAGYSQKMHAEKVVQHGQRPTIDPSWPASWGDLMQSCWQKEYLRRPSMALVCSELQARVEELSEEDGVVPSRASEIRAKRRKARKPQAATDTPSRLDVDTRIAVETDTTTGVKRFESDIV